MLSLYALSLQSGKFYVGTTTNFQFRISNHKNAKGSQWTKIYPLVEAKRVLPKCDRFDEDKYTLKYMASYGIDNVRGGSFSHPEIYPNTREIIKKMLFGPTTLIKYIKIQNNNGLYKITSETDDIPPVSTGLLIIKTSDPYDVNKTVVAYMTKYGIDKVRGGSFTAELLSDSEKKVLSAMMNSGKNVCFKCGSSSHYSSNCMGVTQNKNIKIAAENTREAATWGRSQQKENSKKRNINDTNDLTEEIPRGDNKRAAMHDFNKCT